MPDKKDEVITQLTNRELRDIARKVKARHPDLAGVGREHIRTVLDLINDTVRVRNIKDTHNESL